MSFTLTPVSGEDFVGRETLVSELVEELSSKNRIGFSISGIRRIGKTSILKESERRLVKDHGIKVIYVSTWRTSPKTVDEFVHVLGRATLKSFESALPAKFRFEELLASGAKALGRLLENLKLTAKVAEDLEASVSYVRRESTDVDIAITRSFSLIEHLAEMTRKKCVLMIDEFPSLVELAYGRRNQTVGESMIRLIRTLYEDFKNVKLVISGSYRQTMENLVTKSKAPFYKQLLIREVGPFDHIEFDEFIRRYFRRTKFTEAARNEMYRVSSAIPYNLQLLGKEMRLQASKIVDSDEITKAVKSILEKEGDLSFREYIEDLSPSEVKVMRALVRSQGSKANEISQQEFMDGNTVRMSLNQLVKKGMLARRSRGVYDFTDNLFAAWLSESEKLLS